MEIGGDACSNIAISSVLEIRIIVNYVDITEMWDLNSNLFSKVTKKILPLKM